MKKSERIQADLDKAGGYYTRMALKIQLKRELRYERFKESYFKKKLEMYKIEKGSQRKFILYTHRFGILHFFPISDKIRILSPYKNIIEGFDWIDKNLIEPKEYA